MKRKKSHPQHIEQQAVVDQNFEPSRGGVCRDFLRNVCTRGDSCKFAHVIPSIEFCHDFQNTSNCPRKHCKYAHGTCEDEQYYLANGALPEHLKPVCINYLKNKCTRIMCKFLHPPKSDDTVSNNVSSGQNNNRTNEGHTVSPQNNIESSHISNQSKRDLFLKESLPNVSNNIVTATAIHSLGVEPKKSKKSVKMAEVKAMKHLLSQENEFLKMKLHEMEQHLSHLQSNNHYLIQENQRLKEEAQTTNRMTSLTTLAVPHSATNVTHLAVPHCASVTALAAPYSATNVTHLAVPHSATNVTALAVPHSATNVTHLAVPHSTSMAIAVPHSASVTALAVPHSATNVTHLAVPHSATNVTALAVPHSSSMTIAVPAMTITNTKQQMMSGTTLVPVSIATMTAGTPVSITTGAPVSIATVSMAPVQIPPVVSVPASLEQTSVLYPILTQMCTK